MLSSQRSAVGSHLFEARQRKRASEGSAAERLERREESQRVQGTPRARGPAAPPLTASRTRPWRAGLGLCTGVRAVPSPWSQKAASGGLVVNL